MNSPTQSPPRAPRSWGRAILTFCAAFVLGGLILPYLRVRVSWQEPESQASPGVGLGVAPGAPQPLSEIEAYAHAAKIASPAVVNIDMKRRVRVQSFWGDDWMMGGPRYQEAASEGSGVIINKSGDILTNEHVVGAVNEADKKITVTLQDGSRYEGTVIGSDHTTDVALVHINGGNLPTAPLGTARGLVPGQMAVAIGNPYGFRFTVTHGVVSALDRPLNASDGRVYERLIQTDCAINPGNSGGALVNMQGQVIGINTVIYSPAQNIGFAIPIDTALRVADELKRYGKVKRSWIGLVVVTNTRPLATRFGLPDVAGVAVDTVYPGSPAAAAGIRPLDVVVSVDGHAVHTDEDFKSVEKKLPIGKKVKVEVQREDLRASGMVTVGEAP